MRSDAIRDLVADRRVAERRCIIEAEREQDVDVPLEIEVIAEDVRASVPNE